MAASLEKIAPRRMGLALDVKRLTQAVAKCESDVGKMRGDCDKLEREALAVNKLMEKTAQDMYAKKRAGDEAGAKPFMQKLEKQRNEGAGKLAQHAEIRLDIKKEVQEIAGQVTLAKSIAEQADKLSNEAKGAPDLAAKVKAECEEIKGIKEDALKVAARAKALQQMATTAANKVVKG